MKILPTWLHRWICAALIGEIYPEIRAIVVGFSEENELLIRYYLDREPIEDDYDSVDMLISEVLANTSSASEITYYKGECIFSKEHMSELNQLDELIYARREYSLI